MKHIHASVWWLIFGPLTVLILLPILNVLFHIEEAMHPALPTLLIYVLMGRFFIRGLLAGSVKG